MSDTKKVLVVVDVQRDFFDPSGALYVKGGELLPELIQNKFKDYGSVIFTLDWHPANHCSFKKEGGIWPVHCVAYTQGAGLPDSFSDILSEGKAHLFFKGTEQDREQYGAFEDLQEGSPILECLRDADSIDVCGIAGDYCVKESTANILKYVSKEKVHLLLDCIASIDNGSTIKDFALSLCAKN